MDSDRSKEKAFFESISLKILELVTKFEGIPAVVMQKGQAGDYATEIDVAVEKLIVDELESSFPSDKILAEESHPDTAIGNDRIWIIDPICGTNNLGRGIRNYCTNIALADNRQLIAACVIDHAWGDVITALGDNKVIVSGRSVVKRESNTGVAIDMDLGFRNLDSDARAVHAKFANLLAGQDITLLTLNTSLDYAYVATGKLDAYVNVFAHPWDVCASVFLIMQSGGTVTQLDGTPWEIDSSTTVAASNEALHSFIISTYKKAWQD
jgi:myo-inositol-1(or 4)-monophosphatase